MCLLDHAYNVPATTDTKCFCVSMGQRYRVFYNHDLRYANKHDIGSGARFCGVEGKCCQIHKTEGLRNYILKTLYK